MALPEQVRKQTEAVQELYKQLNDDGATGDDQSAEETTSEAAEADRYEADENFAEDNAAPSSTGEHKSEDDKASEETLLQKYRTLQGMYNAEVPRMHSQNRELQGRVQQMEQLLASLSAQQNASRQPAQAQKYLSDKDVEDYGDSIDVMRKVTREELGAVAQRIAQLEGLVRQMQTNVVPQVQSLAQRQAVSSEQQFWADLGSMVPNWREVNDNQDFQSWLLEVDPMTGSTRQAYLEDAQRNLDPRRVASFFRTWLERNGQATVAQPKRSAQSSELEKQVAPGRSRGAGSPQSGKGKVYSPQDIQKFFDDVRSGKYRGREQERNKIERDIFAAQREGRIQVGA
jgi:hypothetical protein